MSFKSLNLKESTLKALERNGISSPFPVQEKAFESFIKRNDLTIQAPTGSGKTLAYLLPVLSRLNENPDLQCMIMSPSFELTVQIFKELEKYKPAELSILSLSGSGNIKTQKDKLKKKKPSIIVGTPMRIFELIDQDLVFPENLDILVLDEADLILIGRNTEYIESFMEMVPINCQLVTASATTGKASTEFAENYMRNQENIDLGSLSETLEHFYLFTHGNKKELSLLKLIKQEKVDSSIIFVNSTSQTSHLKNFLAKNKVKTLDLSSFKGKFDRKDALDKLKKGEIKAVIATDALARGIDISEIDVINYDPARNIEAYIHRSGRSGRAGKKGRAFTIATQKNFFVFQKQCKILKISYQEIKLNNK